MAKSAKRTALLVLISAGFLAIGGSVAAQGSGVLEAVMTRNLTLPQTAWIKGEALGGSATELRLRETVDLQLRQRGYLPEKFSPYAIRIELRGAGVDSVEPTIPQYANPQPRLSLWNASRDANAVTVSLLLYHQSTGSLIWQAEATCPGIDAAAIPASMIVPMMQQFGRSAKTSLGCARSS